MPRLLILFYLVLSASCSYAQSAKSPLRPGDIFANPSPYLGREIEVEIVEPIDGPASPAALAALEYGQLRVRVPDGMNAELSLAPEGFSVKDPNRYRRKFDRVIQGPLKVRGHLLRDPELEASLHHPVFVLSVSSVQPLESVAPIPVASMADLKARAAALDRKRIVYEGNYRTGFEVSSLDKEIWLSAEADAQVIGKPALPAGGAWEGRLRVTGILFAKPGARYGHMGGYTYQIQASQLEYLGASVGRP